MLIEAAGQINLTGIQSILLSALGTAVFLILAWRLTAAWATHRYGEIVTEIIACMVVGWFIFDPAGSMATLNSWRTSIFA
jgi:hypothetical protein